MVKYSQLTSHQVKLLHALLRNQSLLEVKPDLVRSFTGGRTTHCTEMYRSEFNGLVKALQKDDPKRKMIRKIYAIGYELGWLIKGDYDDSKMNAAKVNAFLQSKHSVVRKPLGKCSIPELSRIVTQWEKIRAKALHFDLKSICEEVGVIFEPK